MVGLLREGWGKTHLTTKQKNIFIKGNNGRKKYEPVRSRVGGGYPDLSGPTTKKHFFMSIVRLT